MLLDYIGSLYEINAIKTTSRIIFSSTVKRNIYVLLFAWMQVSTAHVFHDPIKIAQTLIKLHSRKKVN